LLTIEESYQLFLNQAMNLLNEQRKLVTIDHQNRSFSFEWLFNAHHTTNTYTFDETFFNLCNQKEGFRHAYHVESVIASSDSYKHSCLCFRTEDGKEYSLIVSFHPANLSMVVRYNVFKKDSSGKWTYETLNSTDITPEMREWQHIVLEELYRSASLRLFHITGALKLDDHYQA